MRKEELLKGAIDIHFHTMPDVRERRYDDVELARVAASYGARAIVVKSHVAPTTGRAFLASKVVEGIQVFGGITLNPQVGGINPLAVASAIKMNAKIVWPPTSYSEFIRKKAGYDDGVKIVESGELVPELKEVIHMIAKADIAIGTGHISLEETYTVVEYAVSAGVRKIIINHPEKAITLMPIEDQIRLSKYKEVFFERCYAERTNGVYHTTFEENIEAIKAVGYESTILATDGGQVENPEWPEMFGGYLLYLYERGFSKEQLDRMCKVNPAYILGI
jgi:hypothetical protein